MSKTLQTVLLVLAVVAIGGILYFFGSMYARAGAFSTTRLFGYGWNDTNPYSRGMMGTRYGSNRQSDYGRGPGMMGGYGWNKSTSSNLAPLTVDQARSAAEKYVASLNNSDLKIAEIMLFNNNAYVAVKEASTGLGAFELLVDPALQVAYPEYGPNMMWNLKYSGLNHANMMGGRGGMMSGKSGMTGSWGNQNTVPANIPSNMPVTKDQAIKNAQVYLDSNIAGAAAANDPTQFYGYYTLDFSKDGKPAGMLSVNGFSGQVFLHTWHDTFIEESEIQ